MIKFLILDVDGTLTDGKIYMGRDNEIFKAFDIKDGCGIKDIAIPQGITPIIITARNSEILSKRCAELNIKDVHQGVRNKMERLNEILQTYGKRYSLCNCAYMGDDILDLQCMKPIKEAGGIVACPADAMRAVKAISNYVCVKKAGEGAVREFIEYLVGEKVDEKKIKQRVDSAIDFLRHLKDVKDDGKRHIVDENFFYVIQSYKTRIAAACELESHRKYIDIQIMISGTERMDIADISRLDIKEEYDDERDVVLWNIPERMLSTSLKSGDCIVLYPENAHRGAVTLDKECDVLKIVGKVRI